ncbi:DMT family transporter [uncultured Sunxiuqinia sp.]|uniref:DMT family transporter n=1 Tax=uncultured Sunxiuqinia sp. TaxID=1573825 RepID=UPI002631C9CC|nr:DMT family transporter [uncultured Sunxiuqinia sp.]
MRNLFSNTIFLAIIACLLWSSAFVGVKIGLQYHSPFQFAGVRFTLSGLMLFLYFNNFKEYRRQLFENSRFILLIALLQTVVQYMFFYAGINLLPASISALIIGASPLFISVVSHFSFHNDKMDLVKTLSILVGVIGVGVITFGRSELPSGVKISLWGIALLLMNNFVSGFSNVMVAKKPKGLSPVVLSSSSLFIGGIGLLLISVPLEGFGLRAVAPEYFYALGWLSFLSAAAFSIWFTLLERPGVKVSELNTWKFLVPVAGAVLGWVFMPDESPDWVSISGMLIIACSLLVLNYSNRRAARQIKRNAALVKPEASL